MAKKFTDPSGYTSLEEESADERRDRIMAELEKYKGMPTEETTRGQVPEYLRGKQEYRPNPEFGGKYMIYDKESGQFLNTGSGRDQDIAVAPKREYNLGPLKPETAGDVGLVAKGLERNVEQAMAGRRQQERPDESFDFRSRMTGQGAPAEQQAPARDLLSEEDINAIESRRGVARQYPETSTRPIELGEGSFKKESALDLPSENTLSNIRNSRKFLEVLQNREKSKSKYKGR